MNWMKEYRAKIVSPADAVAGIASGQRVFVSGNVAVPTLLVDALAARRDELRDVEIIHLLVMGESPLVAPGTEGHFRPNAFFVGPGVRAAVREGRADYLPIFLSEIPLLMGTPAMPIDCALIHTTPPDEHGFLSFGVEVSISKPAAEKARVVIAQVNERMPRTLGDSFIHVSKVHRICECTIDLPELAPGEFTDVERRIGLLCAERVPDGATLQLGIGGIPDAVLAALRDKRDLGVHTEMFSDGVMDLMERGVVTNERKTLHAGKVISSFAMGTRALYEFLHNNPVFEFHPSHYTNDPFVISRNARMISINSAIEVDVTGQVCADSIGPAVYSGIGGQVDFVRGASRSEGGASIIALPSTARGGTVSRIVERLQPGAGVVTSRGDVRTVVTEHGIADLFGKNLRQRREALAGIAAEPFRDALRRPA